MRRISLFLSFIAALTSGAQAQFVDITADGTAFLGTNPPNLTSNGNPNTQNGNPGAIKDGNINSSEQAFGDVAYAGVGSNKFLTDTASSGIVEVTANFVAFYDGGWFGVNHLDVLDETVQANQASGGVIPVDQSLTLAELVPPSVQVTTDGTNWTTVASTSNYDTQLQNLQHYNPVTSPLVTFNLTVPQTNVEGVRLIGTTGGLSDFLSVAEFHVLVAPEPSTDALMGFGLLALFGLNRWRKLA